MVGMVDKQGLAFHVACPFSGRHVCYCTRGAPSFARNARASTQYFQQAYLLWNTLQQKQEFYQKAADAYVELPCLLRRVIKKPDPSTTGLPERSVANKQVQAAATAAERAVSRTAKAAAAAGLEYTPPVDVPVDVSALPKVDMEELACQLEEVKTAQLERDTEKKETEQRCKKWDAELKTYQKRVAEYEQQVQMVAQQRADAERRKAHYLQYVAAQQAAMEVREVYAHEKAARLKQFEEDRAAVVVEREQLEQKHREAMKQHQQQVAEHTAAAKALQAQQQQAVEAAMNDLDAANFEELFSGLGDDDLSAHTELEEQVVATRRGQPEAPSRTKSQPPAASLTPPSRPANRTAAAAEPSPPTRQTSKPLTNATQQQRTTSLNKATDVVKPAATRAPLRAAAAAARDRVFRDDVADRSEEVEVGPAKRRDGVAPDGGRGRAARDVDRRGPPSAAAPTTAGAAAGGRRERGMRDKEVGVSGGRERRREGPGDAAMDPGSDNDWEPDQNSGQNSMFAKSKKPGGKPVGKSSQRSAVESALKAVERAEALVGTPPPTTGPVVTVAPGVEVPIQQRDPIGPTTRHPPKSMLLKVTDLKPTLTGHWLRLYWPDDNQWWPGQVLMVDPKNHAKVKMFYETGDMEDLNLLALVRQSEAAWLDPPSVRNAATTDAAPAAAKPSAAKGRSQGGGPGAKRGLPAEDSQGAEGGHGSDSDDIRQVSKKQRTTFARPAMLGAGAKPAARSPDSGQLKRKPIMGSLSELSRLTSSQNTLPKGKSTAKRPGSSSFKHGMDKIFALGPKAVDRAVSVWWPTNVHWYPARVVKCNPKAGELLVKYSNGRQEALKESDENTEFKIRLHVPPPHGGSPVDPHGE